MQPRTSVKTPSIWTSLRKGPLKVCIVGSGNWACAISRIVGQNVEKCYFFERIANMWVYDELVDGQKLSHIINTTHENKKYMPGIKLPENIRAVPDLLEAVKGAHVLVFVVPHQFVGNVCKQLAGHVEPGARAVSLIKGFEGDGEHINLISEHVKSALGIECSSLSGANVADSVAREEFCETTIGYENFESAQILQELFDAPYFRVSCVPDVAGVEICGALKNVVALAAGFCDGLKLGSNTKAAIMRIGMNEMRHFAYSFYDGIVDDTFWDSAGFADVITSCMGGRNRKCAEEFVKSGMSWKEIEEKSLGGQKLQGTGTARAVYGFLDARKRVADFPLFSIVYNIVVGVASPKALIEVFSIAPKAEIKIRPVPTSGNSQIRSKM